jgi:hypothetical protein
MRNSNHRWFHSWPLACALILSGCERAPVFNVWGSFFPAWLVCIAAGVLSTFITNQLLRRLHIQMVLPIVTYPSLVALFTFALWLALFR